MVRPLVATEHTVSPSFFSSSFEHIPFKEDFSFFFLPVKLEKCTFTQIVRAIRNTHELVTIITHQSRVSHDVLIVVQVYLLL